jgi:hypothetical protein
MAKGNKKTLTNERRQIPLRMPGEKVSVKLDSPSKALFDEVKKQSLDESNVSTSTTSSPSSTSTAAPFFQTEKPSYTTALQPVSPLRDFQKVPNSLTRDALPAGVFRGKSKQVYDYLWAISRGAINPSRTVRCSRKQIMRGSGIGSLVTVDAALLHLEIVGLVNKLSAVGAYEGNEYEIFTFEEIAASSTSTPRTTNTSSTISLTSNTQNLVALEQPQDDTSSIGQVSEISSTYSIPKTNIKTIEKIDDEPAAAFSELIKILAEATENLTGKKTTIGDKHKWRHVAEILVAQLEIISSRTAISNAPAILAEHLHRLLNSRRAQEQMGLITPAEAKLAREVKSKENAKEIIPDLYLCPDCFGTGYWNPDGKGRRPGCEHLRLDEARERAKEDEVGG